MIGFLAVLGADAMAIDQKLCFELDTDYDELIPYGTWWTTNDRRDMFGVKVQAQGGPPPGYLITGYAEELGADSGCVTFPMASGWQYDIIISQQARISGRDIFVVDDETDPISQVSGQVVSTSFVATGTPETFVINYSREWGALNVAAWMFRRNSFGLSAASHPLRIASPGSGSGTGANVNYVRIQTDRKRAMSHEVGHWIGMRLDEQQTIVHDGGASLDGCDGGGGDDLTKEWDSRAASEGWGDYVAAWAWNTQNQNKCALQKSNSTFDFDLDDDADNPSDVTAGILEQGQWGCEGALEDFNSDGDLSDPGEPLWTGWTNSSNNDNPAPWPTTSDWLERMVLADDDNIDGVQCQGTLVGRSSKADWTRFFWDFCRDYTITATQCAAVFDAADPRNWDGTPTGTGDLTDDPIRRMREAADDAGFLTEFDAEAHNGLDHY